MLSDRAARPRRVLLTGAAGLIGGELCGVLAGRGHGVVALVRRGRRLGRSDGTACDAASWDGTPPRPGTIALLPGDVSDPALGLDPGATAALAAQVDLVVHGAAATAFDLDHATHRAVNVGGTAHLLAFAERARLPTLHVSTAYVCGERDGPVGEDDPAALGNFANAYEATKAEAERLVAAARGRGLPVAVARPSVVVGAWADGALARFDGIYGLFRLMAEGRVRVAPVMPGASLDLVPIDHVTGALADIAERIEAAAGRTFHLVSGAPVTVAALAGLAAAYPGFRGPRLVAPDAFDPASLRPAERRLHERVVALYASYLRRDPRFDDRNLRALCGRACPPTDRAFLRRLVDRCLAAGFLRPGSVVPQRTSG